MLKKSQNSQIFNIHLLAILLAILNVNSFKIAGIGKIMPLFDLMVIFYFTIFCPIFSIPFIFLLGILNDALQLNFIGVSSLIYILLIKFFLILNNRMIIAENFRHIWQQFALFSLLYLLLKLIIISLLSQVSYDFIAILAKWILSIVAYGVIHKAFDFISKNISKDS